MKLAGVLMILVCFSTGAFAADEPKPGGTGQVDKKCCKDGKNICFGDSKTPKDKTPDAPKTPTPVKGKDK